MLLGFRLLFVALLVGPAPSCLAQLQSVSIGVSGLDCTSCAESAPKRLQRLAGVASVRFDAERGVVVLEMKAENRVKLGVIRDALKAMGYTPGSADIVAIGSVRDGALSLPHEAEAFVLEGAEKVEGRLRVEGSVAAGGNGLKVRSVRALE